MRPARFCICSKSAAISLLVRRDGGGRAPLFFERPPTACSLLGESPSAICTFQVRPTLQPGSTERVLCELVISVVVFIVILLSGVRDEARYWRRAGRRTERIFSPARGLAQAAWRSIVSQRAKIGARASMGFRASGSRCWPGRRSDANPWALAQHFSERMAKIGKGYRSVKSTRCHRLHFLHQT